MSKITETVDKYINEAKMTFSVYDNGGKTADRYTVISSDDIKNKDVRGMVDMLGLSDNPTHPQGFSQFGQGQVGSHLGKKIRFESLTPELKKHIMSRYS